jgi:hypothetical protein
MGAEHFESGLILKKQLQPFNDDSKAQDLTDGHPDTLHAVRKIFESELQTNIVNGDHRLLTKATQVCVTPAI